MTKLLFLGLGNESIFSSRAQPHVIDSLFMSPSSMNSPNKGDSCAGTGVLEEGHSLLFPHDQESLVSQFSAVSEQQRKSKFSF